MSPGLGHDGVACLGEILKVGGVHCECKWLLLEQINLTERHPRSHALSLFPSLSLIEAKEREPGIEVEVDKML